MFTHESSTTMKLLLALSLSCLSLAAANPFLEESEAKSLLHSRSKRANKSIEEATMPADFERECIEELCSAEEYMEAFENVSVKNARPKMSRNNDFKDIYQDCWNVMDRNTYTRTSKHMNFKKACFLAYHTSKHGSVKLTADLQDLFKQ